ncbi:hypothetical protein GCM10009632_10770 [Mycolicibacterium alvei]|uniref:Uncharacterized protein n=1 Tax=Mycolicibacterium alvei TaxID=67081 RepID=A0A6N4UW47_9MYCO|nr:hypothetical protein MALV_31780 [Mycolicibacterium alvei]
MEVGTAADGAVVVDVELATGGVAGGPHDVTATIVNMTVPMAQSRQRRVCDMVTGSTVADRGDGDATIEP